VQLDGFRYKHFISTNCDVYYNDGPVQLEEVYFVRCRLHLSNDPASLRLAHTLLTSSSTTFANPI